MLASASPGKRIYIPSPYDPINPLTASFESDVKVPSSSLSYCRLLGQQGLPSSSASFKSSKGIIAHEDPKHFEGL